MFETVHSAPVLVAECSAGSQDLSPHWALLCFGSVPEYWAKSGVTQPHPGTAGTSPAGLTDGHPTLRTVKEKILKCEIFLTEHAWQKLCPLHLTLVCRFVYLWLASCSLSVTSCLVLSSAGSEPTTCSWAPWMESRTFWPEMDTKRRSALWQMTSSPSCKMQTNIQVSYK